MVRSKFEARLLSSKLLLAGLSLDFADLKQMKSVEEHLHTR
jgi:hypothetical protein